MENKLVLALQKLLLQIEGKPVRAPHGGSNALVLQGELIYSENTTMALNFHQSSFSAVYEASNRFASEKDP